MTAKRGELQHTVSPLISVDEFEPKSGLSKEVIVIGLSLMNEKAAKELDIFVQRGWISIVDSEPSPNPDENGHYALFVEFKRNNGFKEQLSDFLKDIENLTGKMEWMIKPYLSDEHFDLDDEQLFNFIITDPESYVDKQTFLSSVRHQDSVQESIRSFFKESNLKDLTIDGNRVIFRATRSMTGTMIGFGESNEVLKRHRLVESPIKLIDAPIEVQSLSRVLGGGWEVYSMKEYAAIVNESDHLLLVKNLIFSF